MEEHDALLEDVRHHRKLAKLRLKRLLQAAQIKSPFDDESDVVEFVVFNYHHTRFNTFFAQMRGMFASAPHAVDKDALVLVMSDVWHYYPHSSLDGKSPAEILDAGQPLGRWKTKPTKRTNRSSA